MVIGRIPRHAIQSSRNILEGCIQVIRPSQSEGVWPRSVEFSYVSAPYFGTGVQEVIAVSGVPLD